MKLYLSSFQLGKNPQRLPALLSSNKTAAVIVNAIDDAQPDIRKEKLAKELSSLKSLRINAEELDLRKYFGNKTALSEKLSGLAMVWIRGGNTFILRRAMAYSGFDEMIREKKSDKNFVYAGYSAGICCITPTLKGTDLVDDPHIVPDGYKNEVIWESVGLIPYKVIPHYRSDHPESAAVEKEIQYYIDNKILFKALHDGEVIIETV